MLANKVAEILCKEYPDIRITTLVYGSGKLNAGKIKAHPNVTLFLAPIGARYNVVQMLIPLSENPVIVESIRECRRSTDHIFFWDYLDTTSYPFPNFDQVKETLRFLAEQKHKQGETAKACMIFEEAYRYFPLSAAGVRDVTKARETKDWEEQYKAWVFCTGYQYLPWEKQPIVKLRD